MAEQQYQQQIQDRSASMLAAANQALQTWKVQVNQVYVAGDEEKNKKGDAAGAGVNAEGQTGSNASNSLLGNNPSEEPLIKAGDVLFAVLRYFGK